MLFYNLRETTEKQQSNFFQFSPRDRQQERRLVRAGLLTKLALVLWTLTLCSIPEQNQDDPPHCDPTPQFLDDRQSIGQNFADYTRPLQLRLCT